MTNDFYTMENELKSSHMLANSEPLSSSPVFIQFFSARCGGVQLILSL